MLVRLFSLFQNFLQGYCIRFKNLKHFQQNFSKRVFVDFTKTIELIRKFFLLLDDIFTRVLINNSF